MRRARYLGSERQRGAAILAAMVTVVLVATIAAAAVQQQWRMVEVESAERTRQQAQWLLRGALDWSRLLLRQDAQSNGGGAGVDHLAEPWAIPLQSTRVSSFLTADQGVSDASVALTEAYLAGGLEDLQGRLNVLNLVYGDAEVYGRQLQRLFERLGLPQAQYVLLRQGLLQAADADAGEQRPLMPQRVQDLAWLGLAPETVQRLAPYVAMLPAVVAVNLNTASAQVIWAVAEGVEWGQVQALVSERRQQHFKTVAAAQALLQQGSLSSDHFTTASHYFVAQGQARVNDIGLSLQAVLQRANTTVTAMQVQAQGWRTGALGPSGATKE